MRMRIIAALLAISLVPLPATARTNFLEVFAKSNEPQCVELQLEGFAVFARLSLSGIRFYASPITAHYNPDFVVSAYPRLGNSPILESVVGFGPAQNLISQPVLEAMTGRDAPETYRDVALWSGQQSEGMKTQRTGLQYFETEVFGHPGNIFTLISDRVQNINRVPDMGELGSAALNTVDAQLSRNANRALEVIANASTRLGDSWNEGVDFNPRVVAANAITGNLARLANDPAVSGGIEQVIDRGEVNEGEQTLLTRLLDAGVSQADDALTELGIDDPNGLGHDIDLDDLTRIDFAGLPADVVDALRHSLANLTPESIIESLAPPAYTEALAMAQEVEALFESTRDLSDLQGEISSLGFGVSAELMTWRGLCPSDTTMFTPYYLSGLNVPAWRFKIPEIADPRTYIPFSKRTTIGEFFPGTVGGPRELLEGLAELQNYGSVYPRNGYLLQADPVKAAAVTAFRAAHVVTRRNQVHVYRYAAPRNRSRLREMDATYNALDASLDGRAESTLQLEPYLQETGRWQLVYTKGGQEDTHCHRFGAPEVNPPIDDTIETANPLTDDNNDAGFATQWTDNRRSEDGAYVFNLWRRYRCAPEPGRPRFGTVRHLGNVVIPTITIVE
ncbi:MAG: TraU family protein [Pseudomonadota bacterium]